MKVFILSTICLAASNNILSIISEGKMYLSKIDDIWKTSNLLGKSDKKDSIDN